MKLPNVHELKPYPELKESGAGWLGKVPVHWQVRKLRHTMRTVAQRNRPDLPLLSVVRKRGVVIRDVSNRDENHNYIPDDLTNYKVVKRHQFAMNKMKAWQGSYGVSNSDGIVSPAYYVFAIEGVDPGYFHVAIRSKTYVPYFARASDGVRIGQWDLSIPRMREIPFCVPPVAEQTTIVRFLDHADQRIRRYIRAKQKLIALLEEQKQAITHKIVRGQIDLRSGQPYSSYKDSGVEWLGYVPRHWEMRRLKTLCSMKSGEAITQESIEPMGEFPVYGGNGIRGYTSNYTHEGNSVLIGRQGALCGNVHVARGQFWASEHAVVVTLNSGIVLGWFSAILDRMNLNQYSIAAAQPGLAVERVMNLWLPVPPRHVQAAISRCLDKTVARFDASVAPARAEIALAEEYRIRLIADVVTGKLDVRETAVELPEEVAPWAPGSPPRNR